MIAPRQFVLIVAPLALLCAASAVLSLLIGPSGYSASDILSSLFGDNPDDTVSAIASLRAGRTVAALITGAALAAAGVVAQGVMRNPLADPYILGVSGGAGLAVVIFTALAGSLAAFGGFVVAIPAIIGALAAVVLITAVIARFPAIGLEGLILLGVMINSVAGSLIITIASFLGETQLLSFYRWMLGSFSIETYTSNTLAPAAILTVGLVALLMLDARKLNLLALGAEQASSLGVRAGSTRRYMLAVTGVLTAIAVSLAGLVGFVGLVAPHICRRIWGSDARILLPASALMGATAVVLCDSLARVLAKPTELPAGVVTAVLGAPVFIALLVARARREGGAE